jgi:hypothetical protein
VVTPRWVSAECPEWGGLLLLPLLFEGRHKACPLYGAADLPRSDCSTSVCD